MARILVVDDSHMCRELYAAILSHEGHVVEAIDPLALSEVEPFLKTWAPDLLVTDLLMPSCNGATLARLAHQAIPGLPIVVVTGIRDPVLMHQFHPTPPNAVLYKPVDPRALVEVVRELLGPSSAPQLSD